MSEVGYRQVTYTLKTKDGRYCWLRDDGVPLSPSFDSLECAVRYRENMPMLTAEEWRERAPLPENPLWEAACRGMQRAIDINK